MGHLHALETEIYKIIILIFVYSIVVVSYLVNTCVGKVILAKVVFNTVMSVVREVRR
jgi:hypothetical protein